MFKYERKTEKSFQEAVDSLTKSLKDIQFGLLWQLDFKEKLKEKDLEFKKHFMIFEVCNPVQAQRVLESNIEVGYFLPCKLAIYEKDHEVYIGMMKPTHLLGMLGLDALEDIAVDVEKDLMLAIANAVK